MNSVSIDVIVDGKKIRTSGREIVLKIDGKTVYSSDNPIFEFDDNKEKIKISTVQALIKAANSVFGHNDRYRIINSLVESSKTFTEIKELFNMTSATADYHIKRLSDGLLIYKDENRRYAPTVIGELIIEYFSKFLQATENILDFVELKNNIS